LTLLCVASSYFNLFLAVKMADPVAVLMIGTGEYTTGFGANSSQTDKAAGVVALTMFDLRKRGLVGALHLAGVNGTKFPAIREHMAKTLSSLYPRSGYDLTCATYPSDSSVDPKAYIAALDALPKGSAVIIFTPDDTHFEQAMDAVKRGHHVLVTKPVVKTLAQHAALAAAAAEQNVLVAVEVHKRCAWTWLMLFPSLFPRPPPSLPSFVVAGIRCTLTLATAFALWGTSRT
jgi:D-galacturonate reductase